MKNPALTLLIAFAVFSVIFSIVKYRKDVKAKKAFKDTFPQMQDIRPIGAIVTTHIFADDEYGSVFKILPGKEAMPAIPVPVDGKVVLRPWMPEDEDIVDRLKTRSWMTTLTRGTYLTVDRHTDFKEITVASGDMPLFMPPKELHVCFEAIDVRNSILYRLELSFTHTANTLAIKEPA